MRRNAVVDTVNVLGFVRHTVELAGHCMDGLNLSMFIFASGGDLMLEPIIAPPCPSQGGMPPRPVPLVHAHLPSQPTALGGIGACLEHCPRVNAFPSPEARARDL